MCIRDRSASPPRTFFHQTRNYPLTGASTCDTISFVVRKMPAASGGSFGSAAASFIWSHGSVGRAHRSHRWGHRFESCCDHAQTIRNGWSVFYIDGARSRVIAQWAIARRTRGEQRSAGSVSAPRDYCEPARAQRDHRFASCCDHAQTIPNGCSCVTPT